MNAPVRPCAEHAAEHQTWDDIGARASPSWYLLPLVAAQKRAIHLRLIRQTTDGRSAPRRVLKTDLFEEAFGEDQLLGDFPLPAASLYGVDTAASTTRRAAGRFPHLSGTLAVADLRNLPFRDASFDLIISTSSLDHFESDAELEQALAGLARLLAPGGRMLVTFDNPCNPFYHPLRMLSRLRLIPYPLGRTVTPGHARDLLRRNGLKPLGEDWIIHNPRGLSTLVFLALRKAFGGRASGAVTGLLRLFALLDRLPTRKVTACFYAVWAQKDGRADSGGCSSR